MSELNVMDVMELIPNRFPIYYIDAVESLEPGKKIRARKNLTANEDFFQGYFPDEPQMPGTLILETLAQAGSVLILKSPEFLGKRAYIGGINRAKFLEKVYPGDVLFCEFEITKMKGPVGTADAVAYVGETRVCEAEFTFIVNQDA